MEQRTVIPENIEELVAEYRRMWPLMPVLHSRIAKFASKEAIKTSARRLGLLSRHAGQLGIVFEHEMEAELFQDYLIYMHRPRGISLARQLYNRKLYPPGSDEQMLLSGMSQTRFSVFWIRELHPAGGCVVLDVIGGSEFFVLDQSLSRQEVVGVLAAFRIFPFRNVWWHTGANMVYGKIEDHADLQPLGQVLTQQQERELNEENFRRWRALLAAGEEH